MSKHAKKYRREGAYETLEAIMREWGCESVEELKELAREDDTLYERLKKNKIKLFS